MFGQCQAMTPLCPQGKIILVCVLLGSYNFEAKNSTLNNSNQQGWEFIIVQEKKKKVLNGNRFYLSIPLFWLTWTPLLGYLPPVTFKEGDADLILEIDISTSLLQLSLSFRHLVLFGWVYVYVFLFCCGFYSLQTQTSDILVWECWLCWCIICLTIFSYIYERGHLRRIATDSLGKESTSGNGSIPYVSSFLMAFYLKGPSDTIYFMLLPDRKISLFLVLLPVLTLAEKQTIPDSIVQSWSTSAASFVPLERNLYSTAPPEGVLAPGQCCSFCLWAHPGWQSQPSTRVRK